MSNIEPVRMEKMVYVTSQDGSNIQFLMQHPADGSHLEFHIVDGQGQVEDAYVLRALMGHPLRNAPKGAGGFMIIGGEAELRGLCDRAIGESKNRNPVDEANAEIARLGTLLKEATEKINDLTPQKAGEKPRKMRKGLQRKETA